MRILTHVLESQRQVNPKFLRSLRNLKIERISCAIFYLFYAACEWLRKPCYYFKFAALKGILTSTSGRCEWNRRVLLMDCVASCKINNRVNEIALEWVGPVVSWKIHIKLIHAGHRGEEERIAEMQPTPPSPEYRFRMPVQNLWLWYFNRSWLKRGNCFCSFTSSHYIFEPSYFHWRIYYSNYS